MAVIEQDLVDVDGSAAGGAARMAQVYEALTDEEAYLYCILTDASGLDQAEFLWTDERNPDGCWRAWPFQWPWWRDRSMKQIDQCARAIGKSESIMARACAFPFVHPGQEMVITAPEGIHLDAITDRIESALNAVRLLDEMTAGGRGGIKHRPFHVNFANGARIMGRIPQKSGVGVKGTHPVWLEMDEAQDYPDKGWVEILETINRAIEGAQWRVHGVTRGIRDRFYEYTQDGPDNDFKVHRFTAVHRPNWSFEERAAKVKEYGGSDNDPDFRRNVYGLHGDATNPIFVLHRFMRCVDSVPASEYNTDEYFYVSAKAEQVEDRVGRGPRLEQATTDEHAAALLSMLDFPARHKAAYQNFWAGMDVGLTSDPSEIMVFAEYKVGAKEARENRAAELGIPMDGATRLKLITRVHLERIPDPLQVEAIMWLVEFYRPRAFSLDKTGIGVNLLQDLQRRALKSRLMVVDTEDQTDEERHKMNEARNTLTVIKGYGFAEKVVVEIDEQLADKLPATSTPQEIGEKAGIKRNVKEYATDKLRELVDAQRILLPWDAEIIQQWNGQSWSYAQSSVDAYGRRRQTFSEGVFHCLDAGRMAALGYFQAPIEALLATPPKKKRPVLAQFGL